MSKIYNFTKKHRDEFFVLISAALQQLSYLLAYNLAMRDIETERFAQLSLLFLAATSLSTIIVQPLTIVIIRTREHYPTYLSKFIISTFLFLCIVFYFIISNSKNIYLDTFYISVLLVCVYFEQTNRATILWHKSYPALLFYNLCGFVFTIAAILIQAVSQFHLILLSYTLFMLFSYLYIKLLKLERMTVSLKESIKKLRKMKTLIMATLLFMPNIWAISEVLSRQIDSHWVVIFNYQVSIFMLCCFIPINLSKKFVLDLSEMNAGRVRHTLERSVLLMIYSGILALIISTVAYVFLDSAYRLIITQNNFALSIVVLVAILSFLIPIGNLINASSSDNWALLQNICWCIGGWTYLYLNLQDLKVTTGVETIIMGYVSMLLISTIYFFRKDKGHD